MERYPGDGGGQANRCQGSLHISEEFRIKTPRPLLVPCCELPKLKHVRQSTRGEFDGYHVMTVAVSLRQQHRRIQN
jgi:hypothetical protein